MTIGIITVPDAANFGSFLQAYSLQIFLEKAGYRTVFLNAWDRQYVDRLYYNWIPKKRHFKHPVQFILKNSFGKKEKKYYLDDHRKLHFPGAGGQPAPDVVILGSDEIWNVRTDVFRSPGFYGQGYRNVMTYAVSAGEAGYEDFCRYPQIISDIQKIEKILVRDGNTAEIVKKITGAQPQRTCDPTFLTELSEMSDPIYDSYLQENRYIAVYSYPMSVSKADIRAIRQYADSINCKLVSVGMHNIWCDYNLLCRPTQFCSVLQGAEGVITNTFHGTVFSILNEKMFVSISGKIKIRDLLCQFRLEGQRLDAGKVTAQALTEKLNRNKIQYDEVKKTAEQIRSQSARKLLSAIDSFGEAR